MDLTDEAIRWAYANPYPASIAASVITAATAVAVWRASRALRTIVARASVPRMDGVYVLTFPAK
ncbi:hypothetical protein AB0A98_06260 [Streptomyces chrestomyceticus]|uniref:hypothetical protein n=1 Tax=Streptomyces chrestomyceticus TaxID=68185 RepID=UPI0033ECF40F